MVKQNTSTLKKLIGIILISLALFTSINAYNAIVTLTPSKISMGGKNPTYLSGDMTYTNNIFIASDLGCTSSVGGTASNNILTVGSSQVTNEVNLTSGTKYYFCWKLKERTPINAYVCKADGTGYAGNGVALYALRHSLTGLDLCVLNTYNGDAYIGTEAAQDIATFSWFFYA